MRIIIPVAVGTAIVLTMVLGGGPTEAKESSKLIKALIKLSRGPG